MKKIVYIFIVSLFITSYCEAQVSGYMGKKWLVMYDIYTRPTFSFPNQNGNNGFTSFNLKNSISIEYVPARAISFGVGYGFYNTDFNFQNKNFDYQTSYDGQTAVFLSFVPSAYGKISSTFYSIYLKLFLSQNIAPLGTYVKFQIDRMFWNWTYNINLTSQDPAPAGFPDHGNFSTYGLSFSYGKQNIYFNRFIINTSLQIGVLFSGFNLNDYTNQWFDNGSITPEMYMKDVTATRLFSHYLWNFNIGIGYLIF